ncbi:PH domain-containing protein [Bacillus andreraoultii]|uniref:PH domain-containing protein n=1 Tax=Bacillus andreraoultii TaxID=1499685 RepID=UPI00053ADDA6|nr:PH domain-containing protein [Bacillus andreraoultii]
MIGEPAKRISERALTVWKIRGVITSIISLLITIFIIVLIHLFDWPKWISIVLSLLWIVESYFVIFFNPKLRWKIWRYEVREQEIEIQHGLWVITKTLIPMIRVQHVDHTQGPLLKKYHLATVQISTAATVHEIPALDEIEAEELRKVISKLARVADEDV